MLTGEGESDGLPLKGAARGEEEARNESAECAAEWSREGAGDTLPAAWVEYALPLVLLPLLPLLLVRMGVALGDGDGDAAGDAPCGDSDGRDSRLRPAVVVWG